MVAIMDADASVLQRVKSLPDASFRGTAAPFLTRLIRMRAQHGWQASGRILAIAPPSVSFTSMDITVALLYLVLAGAFLVVIPAGLYFYLNTRWYVASSFERAFMYFLVFMFFPGLLLLAPFLNFRPKRRELVG